MNRTGAALIAAIAVAFATVAFAQMPPVKTGETAKGTVLTTENGMTLYTFDKDAGGTSACNGLCAGNWPPLVAPADAKSEGDYSIITRQDGSKQWAYKGKPLYGWKNDKKPGDISGDGFLNGAWHIAQP